MKNFADVNIGDETGALPLDITRAQVRAFVDILGISGPRFTDDKGAREEGLPGIIVPGPMILSVLTTFVDNWIDNPGARVTRMGATYRIVVQPDKPMTIQGFVTNLDPAEAKADIDVWIQSEAGDRLVIGSTSVQYPKS